MKNNNTAESFFGFDPAMKIPLISSAGLHILIFILTAVGLPFMTRDPMILNPPVTVEIIKLDKLTQTPKITPVEQIKPPPAPQQTSESPPDLTQKEPEKPKIDQKDMAPPEVVPNPDIKPVPKEKPEKKEKKPDPQATKVEKEEPKKDFASLLKNLTPDVEEDPKPQELTIEDIIDDLAPDTPITQLGEQLTISEQDALRHQLSQCWNVLSGAKYAEDLVVEVRMIVNRDRTVAQASILDQGRYNRDSHFRAAADAALRALRNPRCSPLALPPEKYNEWKTTVIVFDPREML